MKCSKCGYDYPARETKCPYCGEPNKLGMEWEKEEDETRKETLLTKAKVLHSMPLYVANKIMNIILLLAVVLLVVLFLVFFILGYVDEKHTEHQKRSASVEAAEEIFKTGDNAALDAYLHEYEVYAEDGYEKYTERVDIYDRYSHFIEDVMDDIKSHVKDYEDEEEIASYLSKILKKEAFDQKGLIYGMGHAVYSISDPRERVFKGFVEQLARDKGREKDMTLYNNIEKIAPKLIAKQRQIFKGVSPNIDFYSGFVYDMLNIPRELYTPLFAIARIAGWSAHRLEELITTDKIIRPAYKSLVSKKEYIEREER